MKRTEAIQQVIGELRTLRTSLDEGKSLSPLKFLELSEIFKFKITPSKDRFTATILDEASKTDSDEEHLNIINSIVGDAIDDTKSSEVPKPTKDETHTEFMARCKDAGYDKDTCMGAHKGHEFKEEDTEELEELVDYDGSIKSGKIPDGAQTNATIGSKETTDATVAATSQYGVWTSGGNFFKRYYGESVEEADMSKSLGYEETKDLDADDTVEYFEKELDMDEDEAEERTEDFGKTKHLGDQGENYQRLTEKERLRKISEYKAKDVIEVILSDKSDDGGITSSEESWDMPSSDKLLRKQISNLVKLASANDVSIDELKDMI